MAIKCILCYLFMALFISTITCMVSEGQRPHTEDDYPAYTPENMKDIIARELEPLQRIIFEFQNTMTSKMETITVLEDNLNHNMKEITDNILIKQTTNIAKQITEKINVALQKQETSNNRKFKELSDTITSKLAAMNDNLQMNMFKKLEILETNVNVLTTNIKQQNEKGCVYKEQTVPVTVEQVNSRLVALDNITKLEEHSMQNLINISEQIQASVDKLNQQTDYLKNETTITKICNLNQEARESIKNIVLDQTKYITQQVINNVSFVSKQHEIITSIDNIETKDELLENIFNQTTEALKNSSNHLQHCGTGTEPDKLFSWCGSLPNTVNIRDDIWQDRRVPGEDDLDKFLVNKTGCTYRAVKQYDGFYLPEVRYDGTLYEWGVSVRAGDTVYMYVYWGGSWRYSFVIGYDNNTRSYVHDWTTDTFPPLPAALLSRSRYVRFYVRLQPGSVTFGRKCDSAPLYTGTSLPTVAGGTMVKMYFTGYSQFGAKYLYNCPAVTGNIAHTTASSCTN